MAIIVGPALKFKKKLKRSKDQNPLCCQKKIFVLVQKRKEESKRSELSKVKNLHGIVVGLLEIINK